MGRAGVSGAVQAAGRGLRGKGGPWTPHRVFTRSPFNRRLPTHIRRITHTTMHTNKKATGHWLRAALRAPEAAVAQAAAFGRRKARQADHGLPVPARRARTLHAVPAAIVPCLAFCLVDAGVRRRYADVLEAAGSVRLPDLVPAHGVVARVDGNRLGAAFGAVPRRPAARVGRVVY